ncbi:hypothetical protein N1F78_07625 [Seonamhaeicola sp. MEBiC1930]|uniref:hypothetical protein n=1 Tax=Seonamhaeicola sp. MEBiC01930 TaxID=2976768 RepID=UPI003248576D
MRLRTEKSNQLSASILFFIGSVLGLMLMVLPFFMEFKKHEITQELSNLISSFGSILFSTLGIASYLSHKSQKEFLNHTENMLESFFDDALESSVKYGFVGITDRLSFEDFLNECREGDKVYWLDTYAPGYVQWLSLLESKANNGVKFHFLVLNPQNKDLCNLRAKEIGGRYEEAFNEELKRFTIDLHNISMKIKGKGKLDIRLYDDLLANPFYINERKREKDYALSSFYLRAASGTHFPHLKWIDNGGDSFVRTLKQYYKWKWDESIEIDDYYIDSLKKTESLIKDV